MSDRPTVGQTCTIRGIPCVITKILPAGTLEATATDGTDRAFRVSGLAFR